MNKKKVRFGNPPLLPKTRSRIEYEFPFTVVDSSLAGKPEEESKEKQYIINISITEKLAAIWGFTQPGPNLEKVLYKHCEKDITKKLKGGILKEKEEIFLATFNYSNKYHKNPNKCPFDPSEIPEPSQWSFDVQIP